VIELEHFAKIYGKSIKFFYDLHWLKVDPLECGLRAPGIVGM